MQTRFKLTVMAHGTNGVRYVFFMFGWVCTNRRIRMVVKDSKVVKPRVDSPQSVTKLRAVFFQQRHHGDQNDRWCNAAIIALNITFLPDLKRQQNKTTFCKWWGMSVCNEQQLFHSRMKAESRNTTEWDNVRLNTDLVRVPDCTVSVMTLQLNAVSHILSKVGDKNDWTQKEC